MFKVGDKVTINTKRRPTLKRWGNKEYRVITRIGRNMRGTPLYMFKDSGSMGFMAKDLKSYYSMEVKKDIKKHKLW